MNEEELAELLARLPDEIHLIGGPYCGLYLHPHSECIHDVHRDANEGIIPPGSLPTSWSPLGWNCIVMNGPFGHCMYLMESESRWIFKAFVEIDEEPTL